MTFTVPAAKIAKLQQSINDILAAHRFSKPVAARSIAGVTVQLISTCLAIGPVTRLMTRALYRSIETRFAFVIPDCVISELTFWLSNLDAYNGFSIKHQHTPSHTVYSDASDTGYGGVLVVFLRFERA